MSQHWSFSALKSFDNCARRYYEERIARSVVGETHEAAAYGTLVHESIEAHIKDGAPIPPEFSYVAPVVASLTKLSGAHHSEYDLSIRMDYSPCASDASDVWCKGFADFLLVSGDRALVADFKTGKARYADLSHLELYALLTFCHFPEVYTVTGMLLFVKEDVTHQNTVTRAQAADLWLKWIAKLDKFRRAKDFNSWPTNPSGLCKFCPVRHCVEHPSWKLNRK